MRPQNVHPEDLVRVDQIDLRGDWLSQDPDELELVVVALSGPVIRAARTRGRRSGAAATPSDYRSRVGVRRPREPRLSDRRRLTPVRAMPHKDRPVGQRDPEIDRRNGGTVPCGASLGPLACFAVRMRRGPKRRPMRVRTGHA